WMVATGHGLLPSVPLGAWGTVGVVASVAALAAAVVALRPPGPIAPARLVPELSVIALVPLLITANPTIHPLVFSLLPLALLVYVAFWNPWLQFSNTDNFVDGAVSLVDTGRWELVHWRLYEGKDNATARDGRVVPGVPFGMSLVIAPVYAAWRLAGGARVEG